MMKDADVSPVAAAGSPRGDGHVIKVEPNCATAIVSQ